MGFTVIETSLFEAMVAKLEIFARHLDSLCERHSEKQLGTLLGNEDVCRIMRISPRTLQMLHDNGTLAYSQMESTAQIGASYIRLAATFAQIHCQEQILSYICVRF